MNDCRRTAEQLAAFVDRALPSDERAAVEAHLDRCPSCKAAAAAEQACHEVLRERARRLKDAPVPAALRLRCERAAARSAKAPLGRLVPGALTALLAVGVGLAVLAVATPRSDTVLAAQLTADHATCFRLFAPSNPAGVDARQVERMLEVEYGWAVHVPPTSADLGLELVGARRCRYAGGPLPHVMYRAGGRDVSLYILEAVTRPPAEVETFGYRSRVWSRGSVTYVLVWPADAGDLAPVVRYLMQEAR